MSKLILSYICTNVSKQNLIWLVQIVFCSKIAKLARKLSSLNSSQTNLIYTSILFISYHKVRMKVILLY